MPFVARHVRLTNSGKLPDIFLTSKIQGPADLTDAKLGKLFFVLQITAPWSQVASIGQSIINVVGREYYRQEGNIPLENFERAIAKANRLIEQLHRDGAEELAESIHALIALTVGDEIHIAYTGAAEAYFLRDDKLNLVTEPGKQTTNHKQVFNNLITGEISRGDKVLLGSPHLYSAFTPDELEQILQQPLNESALIIARRLKGQKLRSANAIVLEFSTKEDLENQPITKYPDTIYLDQRLDSTWYTFSFYAKKILGPIGKLLRRFSIQTGKGLNKLGSKVRPAVTKLGQQTQEKAQQFKPTKLKLPPVKVPLPKLPNLKNEALGIDVDVPVNYYSSKKLGSHKIVRLAYLPLQILQDVGKQFRAIIKRSPRMWYLIISLILLSSIGASVQTHKAKQKTKPVITANTLTEMKELVNQAKQAKVYGNPDKARQLLVDALAKGDLAKQNPKLAAEASQLYGVAQRDLFSLAGATELIAGNPLTQLNQAPANGLIFEGTFYTVTSTGELRSSLLTGGDSSILATVPNGQAAHLLHLDTPSKTIYLQTYDGHLYSYLLGAKRVNELTVENETIPVGTGLGTYSSVIYLVDPAANQITKIIGEDNHTLAPYTKNKKADLTHIIDLTIDGSIFTLDNKGVVTKFSRGNALSDWHLNGLPKPFDTISAPLTFTADEDASSYYMVDKGNAKTAARIIEFDKTGRFVHQFFLPKKWRSDIKLIITNPKSHKAWVVVNKALYEFTLVQ